MLLKNLGIEGMVQVESRARWVLKGVGSMVMMIVEGRTCRGGKAQEAPRIGRVSPSLPTLINCCDRKKNRHSESERLSSLSLASLA